MATTTTNYGFDVPTSSDLVKNGATAIATLGQDIDTFLFRPFSKNVIINSAFDIWQRGTSLASAASYNHYTADRFPFNFGLNTNATISQQATNDTTNLPFIRYCARAQRNSGATTAATMALNYTLENSDTARLIGQSVTFSFYARAGANYSGAANGLSVAVASGTGTDQSIASGLTGQANFISQTATLTTTWQRFTYTGTVPTTAKQVGFFLYYVTSGTAGAADYFEVTGIQLEQGSQATPYSRNAGTIQGELAACQRYYWRSQNSGLYSPVGNGLILNSTDGYFTTYFPVNMRTQPTSLDFASLRILDMVGGAVAVTAITGLSYSNNAAYYQITGSSMVGQRAAILQNNNNTAGYIGFNAEL